MAGVELVILALLGEKFLVGALFDDTTVVEDDDLVAVAVAVQVLNQFISLKLKKNR